MRRPGQIAVIVVFITVIAGPLVLFLLGVRPELDENRARTRFPALDPAAMVDDETYAQVGAAYTDRLPLRDKAISWYADMQERSTFTDPVRAGLPRGKDGWLYHPDTLLTDCAVDPPSNFFDRGREADEISRASDVPMLFLVAPDKVSVYPDHVPVEGLAGVLGLSVPGAIACTTNWRAALDDATPDQPWLHPMLGSLVERSKDPDEPVFFKLDTHWTDYGALTQVMAVLDEFAPGMWDPNEVHRSANVTKIGDLTRLLGRPRQEEVPGYEIVRPGVEVTQSGRGAGDINDDSDSVIVTRATSTDAPLIEGTTLFISDSFGRRSLKLMAPYFEELVVVSRETLINNQMGAILDQKPDRIIIEQVQRNIAKGWYKEGFDAVLDAVRLPS